MDVYAVRNKILHLAPSVVFSKGSGAERWSETNARHSRLERKGRTRSWPYGDYCMKVCKRSSGSVPVRWAKGTGCTSSIMRPGGTNLLF